MKPAPRLIDARLIAESAIFQATAQKRDAAEAERDRLREYLTHERGEHSPDSNGMCQAEHAGDVSWPCYKRDQLDDLLHPSPVLTGGAA